MKYTIIAVVVILCIAAVLWRWRLARRKSVLRPVQMVKISITKPEDP